MPEQWLRIREAAAYAHVKPRTLRAWLREGLAHSRKTRQLVLIRASAIDEFLRNFEAESSAQKAQEVQAIVDEIAADLRRGP